MALAALDAIPHPFEGAPSLGIYPTDFVSTRDRSSSNGVIFTFKDTKYSTSPATRTHRGELEKYTCIMFGQITDVDPRPDRQTVILRLTMPNVSSCAIRTAYATQVERLWAALEGDSASATGTLGAHWFGQPPLAAMQDILWDEAQLTVIACGSSNLARVVHKFHPGNIVKVAAYFQHYDQVSATSESPKQVSCLQHLESPPMTQVF
ncbi:hypothetical protein C8J57DRAFT_1538038 [Mycena rebaudengoi]|nr:hypothetical protein C8J57DRAFT_1538038 [Mycena rebaudengoi]